jgi:hypothetical protein
MPKPVVRPVPRAERDGEQPALASVGHQLADVEERFRAQLAVRRDEERAQAELLGVGRPLVLADAAVASTAGTAASARVNA